MTSTESALVKKHYDDLDEELKTIVWKVPPHLDGEDLIGYLHFTLVPHVNELLIRQKFAERREDYELALAIQKFLKTRLKEYYSEGNK
jgi:hypothetical protein